MKELGCLPLAIEQAAAFIRESERRIDEYLPLYQENRSTRQELQKWTPEGNRNYQYSVATTWQMSFDLVRENTKSPDAALLLSVLQTLTPQSRFQCFFFAPAKTNVRQPFLHYRDECIDKL